MSCSRGSVGGVGWFSINWIIVFEVKPNVSSLVLYSQKTCVAHTLPARISFDFISRKDLPCKHFDVRILKSLFIWSGCLRRFALSSHSSHSFLPSFIAFLYKSDRMRSEFVCVSARKAFCHFPYRDWFHGEHFPVTLGQGTLTTMYFVWIYGLNSSTDWSTGITTKHTNTVFSSPLFYFSDLSPLDNCATLTTFFIYCFAERAQCRQSSICSISK